MTDMLVETSLEEDAKAARDESRLAMIAYWLAKYRTFKNGEFDAKFDAMLQVLETDEARHVAEAWRAKKSVEEGNRFKPIEGRIKEWAKAVSNPPR